MFGRLSDVSLPARFRPQSHMGEHESRIQVKRLPEALHRLRLGPGFQQDHRAEVMVSGIQPVCCHRFFAPHKSFSEPAMIRLGAREKSDRICVAGFDRQSLQSSEFRLARSEISRRQFAGHCRRVSQRNAIEGSASPISHPGSQFFSCKARFSAKRRLKCCRISCPRD